MEVLGEYIRRLVAVKYKVKYKVEIQRKGDILRQEGRYSDSTLATDIWQPEQHTSTDWRYPDSTTETPGRQL